MVSNALTSRHQIPKTPVVCLAPPKPTCGPVELEIFLYDNPCDAGAYTGLRLWGNHPSRPRLEVFAAEWDPGTGFINPYPDPWNRKYGHGVWHAPFEPGDTEIKCKVTWPDGTVAFTELHVTVAPLP